MNADERDLSQRTVPELLELFVLNLREVEASDHTGRKNRLWAKRKRIVEAIKGATDGTVRALLPLLSDPDPIVRSGSAMYYRVFDHAAYVNVLKELASRDDEIGREAQHSLERLETAKQFSSAPPPRQEGPSLRDSRLCGHKPPTGITRDELEPMLFGAFPHAIATKLLGLARPAIRIWPQPLDPNALPTCSRFGGLPAMPKDWSWPAVDVWPKGDASWFKLPREKWPEFDQEPRWFLAQVNCADLAGLASARAFPREGMLYFFGDSDVVTGCMGGGDDNGVFYWPTAKQLSSAGVPVEDFEILPSCGLGFTDMLDLPHPFSSEIEQLALPKELKDRYHDLREAVSNCGVKAERFRELDRSKLLGWPDLVQGELDSLANASKPRRLLLQIGNYDNGIESYGWGPGGLIYFIINDSDLAEGRVTRAECDFQCT